MRKPEFYSAAFAIIKNEDGDILFQKRKNTGFRDWYYQLPSGHLEWEETMIDCIIRELKEEINIVVKPEDCEVVHISHVVRPWERTYFNIYIDVKAYSEKIINLEEEKCSEVNFFSIPHISNSELFAYDWESLEVINKWEKFSEKLI